MSSTKYIIGGSALVATLGLGVWAYRKKSFGDSLVIINDVNIKFTKKFLGVPSALQMNVTPTIKNPSSVGATITQPFVELRLSKEDVAAFATSQAAATRHKIEPLSEKVLDPIIINISVTDLASRFGNIIKNAIKTKSLSFFVKTTCYLVTGATLKLKVEQEDESKITF